MNTNADDLSEIIEIRDIKENVVEIQRKETYN